MWKREEVIKILNQARGIDSGYELFGASAHRYGLNPPIRASFVRQVEERYQFALPEDYFRFITEVGDGGAGPDYGLKPFVDFLKKGENPRAQRFWEEYRRSLANAFLPRPMRPDEVEDYAIAVREVYEKNRDRYYVCEPNDDNRLCDTNGFYVLGTHGCQWDFGLIITGEKRGQVFDTDNEGAFGFAAGSFEEFYQRWLDRIADTERLKGELEEQRRLRLAMGRRVTT